MDSILPILGIVFLLALFAKKLLNTKEENPVNQHSDEVVADMYNLKTRKKCIKNRTQKSRILSVLCLAP